MRRKRKRVAPQDQKLARRRGLAVVFLTGQGQWQPRPRILRRRFTSVKDLKNEIGAGLLRRMLDDLGIRKGDL